MGYPHQILIVTSKMFVESHASSVENALRYFNYLVAIINRFPTFSGRSGGAQTEEDGLDRRLRSVRQDQALRQQGQAHRKEEENHGQLLVEYCQNYLTNS